MAFWGVQIRSGQPFTLRSANQNGRLHISQATLGDGSSPKKSVLQCNVGNNAPVLLCSLLPDRLESCSLNLEFEEEKVVVFSVLGPRSIHLSGYHIGSSHTRDENDSDSYGENIDIESETDEESSYYDSEDDLDDFIVDDDESLEFDTSPKHVRGGIGEVIKGWDVGINGMRVGDKRRLTIPPSMGYGSTGIGKIPGNAWLVFDVELVNVQ